jgi:hypothetical protein
MQIMMTASKQSQDGTLLSDLEAVIITCMKLTNAHRTVGKLLMMDKEVVLNV